MTDRELLKALFNSFKPDAPLKPGDPRYVDFQAVRGDEDILTELGGYILSDESNTYRLYSGHRGSGKSTELRRLAKHLEDEGCVVVYFAAATDDAGDLSFQDTQYQDILLSCTRQLLDKLAGRADDKPLQDWLHKRWQQLRDLALTEVELQGLTLTTAIPMFAKITATVRKEPTKREEIRKLVEANTESLVEALNAFIRSAKQDSGKRVVVIADNLDRIALIQTEGKPTNLEEIFINRSELMKSLDCHVVYTVPIALLYSKSASDLQDIYGKPQILPMVMMQERESGDPVEEGMEQLRVAIARRVEQVCDRPLVPEVFESDAVLNLLCFSCGGHLRDLMHMARDAVNLTPQLPITAKQVKRAIAKFRPAYLAALSENEWPLLLEVHKTKRKLNDVDGKYHSLLARRCILEYRFFDEDAEIVTWYDVHPLIRGTKLFREKWGAYESE
ncbi:MAG: ATP-binding protein [Spirulina sp. SIO3F2]|nr:ATP-binding protein [Spirulina sp. SIO3F2]